MIKHQSPLETVATLSEMSTLDIDINQSNRYCIKLNSAQGKDAYYFATPIYHAISRKLVNRNFVASNGYYRFVGSNCEATVTATQLKLIQGGNAFCLNFGTAVSWILQKGSLISDQLSITPTYNGVIIEGKINQSTFDISTNFSYQKIRESQNCVCFMEEQFKPILVISALYVETSNNDFHPLQIKYQNASKNMGSVFFSTDALLCTRGSFEINFYEPKLIQDTPVSGKHPKENNAFSPVAFVGKTDFYGTQWLYFRLDLSKMPELQSQYIREVKLYIPRITSNSAALEMFGLENRFCSFGSNWSNKVPKKGKTNCVGMRGDYICLDLTSTYITHGQMIQSLGNVLVPAQSEALGYQVLSTGDSYVLPPILCVKYAKQ